MSCLYGHERIGKNFVYQLWAALSEGREFRPPSDQIGTPTAVSDAADVIRDLLLGGHRGTFHVAGPQPMLLYGYGSYGIPMDPGFRSTRISLLDRGVPAVPVTRPVVDEMTIRITMATGVSNAVSMVRPDASASEVILNQLKHLGPVSVLAD